MAIPMRILRIMRMAMILTMIRMMMRMLMMMRMTKCPLFLFPSAQFPNGSAMESRHSKWYRPFILLFPKNIITSQNIAYSYFNCPNIQQKHQMKFIFCCGLRKTAPCPFSSLSYFSSWRFESLSNQQQWWKKVEVKAINHHIIEQVHSVRATFCFPV